MPRKIRQLEADLAHAGFVRHPGKGSHRHWTHPQVKLPVTVAGQPGDDAQPYQEKAVRQAIRESQHP